MGKEVPVRARKSPVKRTVISPIIRQRSPHPGKEVTGQAHRNKSYLRQRSPSLGNKVPLWATKSPAERIARKVAAWALKSQPGQESTLTSIWTLNSGHQYVPQEVPDRHHYALLIPFYLFDFCRIGSLSGMMDWQETLWNKGALFRQLKALCEGGDNPLALIATRGRRQDRSGTFH